ncbi:MAG: hypothetical protein ABI528_06970, partial [bacterium]
NTSGVLNLNATVEGFYDNAANLMTADTAIVYLRNSGSPYAFVDSSKSVIGINSAGTFNFTNVNNGTPYYVILSHRNSLETWSASPQTFTANIMSYDFTNAAGSAFGNNLKQVDTSPVEYAVYSGDVDKEGTIDAADMILIFNDVITFASGYLSSDVTGNNFTDAGDMIVAYNNSVNFVSIVRP